MRRVILLFALLFGAACTEVSNPPLEEGVSQALAESRQKNIAEIAYNLTFDIPKERDKPIFGTAKITFTVKKQSDIVLDFRTDSALIHSVTLNGELIDYKFQKEHLVLSKKMIVSGVNNVEVEFTAQNQPLNRRDDFLYTLLVPDRARTLFPCFDQPDLKARYTLSLNIPSAWKAISNGRQIERSEEEDGTSTVVFAETEPLSTYLFSFVAGEFSELEHTENGRTVHLFHKETDPLKIAQCPEIFRQVFAALHWMEEYTGIEYSFAKYDLVILPGFQFGGMEHTGATLYNDRTLFLPQNPTVEEQLARAKLIAHETAHMWFGDLVTMKWFSEVWIKEVFANYFASLIVEPLFPEVDHALNFLMNYIPYAYAEDRTPGSNPILQTLDNLQNAGLVYGNIIYDKSPIIMNMLVRRLGAEKFRAALHEYLELYKYGNASWDNLISVLDKQSVDDLRAWSHSWVECRSMPRIEVQRDGSKLILTQTDPSGDGTVWDQRITFLLDTAHLTVLLNTPKTEVTIPTETKRVVVNCDGRSYGYFVWGSEQMLADATSIGDTTLTPLTRGSLLLMIHEAVMRGEIDDTKYLRAIVPTLDKVRNPLLFNQLLSSIAECRLRYGEGADLALEQQLWKIFSESPQPDRKKGALRTYQRIVVSEEGIQRLYELWNDPKALDKHQIGINDAMSMAYELAVRMPEKYSEIAREQLRRINNADRYKEFAYIIPAASNDRSVRDSVFQSLLLPENRRIEPWARTSMGLLNHFIRRVESRQYLLPGLEAMPSVQRTGDIFFPTMWAKSLLKGHNPDTVKVVVNRFLERSPDLNPMLKNKILQQL